MKLSTDSSDQVFEFQLRWDFFNRIKFYWEGMIEFIKMIAWSPSFLFLSTIANS